MPDAEFGGWSGLDFTDNGRSFRAISDAGYTVTGTMSRDAQGAVSGISTGPILVMRGDVAEPLSSKVRDAEGLAVAPGGSYFVSFERSHQVSRYRDDASAADILTYNSLDLSAYPFNAGLESLALAGDGALYALPEDPPAGEDTRPVHVWRAGRWSVPFTFPEDGRWRPVGADFGPDGRLYVLERDLWGLVGFMSRVRRLTISNDRITADEVLWTTRAGEFQNLEGLAAWTDDRGATRLTMISDDNYLFLMRTEIVDVRVTE